MKKIVILLLVLARICQAATLTATKAGNWSNNTVWDTNSAPIAGDTVDLSNYTITMDVNTIPVGGGSLAVLKATSIGQLTVNLNAIGNQTINATTIQAGTKITGLISVTGTIYTLIIDCGISGTITGGPAATAYGVNNTSTGTIYITGNIIGGNYITAYGVRNGSTGIINITGNLIFSNYTTPYMGYRPTLTAGSQYYIQIAGITFPQQLLDHQVLANVNHGGLIGTRVDCPVAKAVSTSGNYGDPCVPLIGIYHEPEANEVWHTAVFGANSEVNGTKVASSIVNCEAANIKKGVTIDDVNGTLSGGVPGGDSGGAPGGE